MSSIVVTDCRPPAMLAIKALIVECLDTQPDSNNPVDHNFLLVHYLQLIEQVVDRELRITPLKGGDDDVGEARGHA